MTSDRVRRLDARDAGPVATLLDADPLVTVYLRSEVRLGALRTGRWWGWERPDGELAGLVVGGPLVVPVLPDPAAVVPLARTLDRQPPPQLMTGQRDQVHAIHGAQRPSPRPREVRDPQPLLALHRGGLRVAPAPAVRRGAHADLDRLTVASAAMHREEMGVDPLVHDPGLWRMRMATFIERRWSFVWEDRGTIIFKAELSAWTPDACLLQGVFTDPSRRGQGIGTAGMAAVCAALLAEVPVCVLYVNHYNEPARRLYATLGFEPVDDFATLFF